MAMQATMVRPGNGVLPRFRQNVGHVTQAAATRWAPVMLPAVIYWRALVSDTRGDEGSTSSIVRTMMAVAGALVVIGGILWSAVRRLGVKVGADIDGAASWAP